MSAFLDPDLHGREAAEKRLGMPVRLELTRPLEDSGDEPRRFTRNRLAEVLMVLPRPGGLLFHTKAFYPRGIYRLPSGGVKSGEKILRAASREVREETGLVLAPTRFLFHLVQRLHVGETLRGFHSLAFLFPFSDGPLQPQDEEEEISDLRACSWEEIPELIRRMMSLSYPWETWGEFRAAPHRLLLEVRRDHPDWFEGG